MDLLRAGNARFYDYHYDDALRAWDRALAMDPALCLVHANRAHAERLLAMRTQALADAEAAVACDPNNAEYAAMRDLLRALNR